MGEAPRLLVVVGPALGLAIGATILFPAIGSFTLRFRGLFIIAGAIISMLGALFWASAAFELVRAWMKKTLATRGAYGLCRHPIFAVWIWFILPAVAFFADSWFFLTAAAIFLVTSLIAARREEEDLLDEFGSDYEMYRERVRSLIPIPRLLPFTGRRFLKGIAGIVALFVIAIVATVIVAVPVGRRLGATGSEARSELPGDELARSPQIQYTQAITIHAPPSMVWPWLIQVGYRRAGWYNIDAINRLAGPDYFIDGESSSNSIHPELQNLKVGDTIALAPGYSLDVVALESERYFIISTGSGPGVDRMSPQYVNIAWSFHVFPVGMDSTRLVVRYRTEFNGGFAKNFWSYFVNDLGGALLQQPAMLQGVKSRSERAWERRASLLTIATRDRGRG